MSLSLELLNGVSELELLLDPEFERFKSLVQLHPRAIDPMTASAIKPLVKLLFPQKSLSICLNIFILR
jgi:hypothetical protein